MKPICTFILLLLFSSKVFAQAGTLDSTFGVNGLVIPGYAGTISPYPNGQFVAGNHRYNYDGTIDSSFTIGLIPGTFNFAQVKMVMQPDGKFAVCGGHDSYPYFKVVRLNSNGSIDSTFGVNGVSGTSFNISGIPDYSLSATVQEDNKILHCGIGYGDNGEAGFCIVRYNTNGSLDHTFNNTGKLITSLNFGIGQAQQIGVQPDGKIVVGGTVSSYDSSINRFALARYNSNGTLDNNFGNNGLVATAVDGWNSYGFAMALAPDNKIILAGNVYVASSITTLIFCRYNADGSLDQSFGDAGVVHKAIPGYDSGIDIYSITLQPDGKIILVGQRAANFEPGTMLITRFNNDGSSDSTFGVDGVVNFTLDTTDNNAKASALQSDGKLLVSGYSAITSGGVLLRFLTDLNLGIITFENDTHPLIYPNPISSTTTLKYSLQQNESITIELFDMQGRLVQTFLNNELRTSGEHNETLSFNNSLSSGNYILRIGNGNGYQAVKIIKQ